MDKAIKYVLLKIEEAYYQQNSNIQIKRGSCMKDEGLKCNCITGIAINYAGYLICICCNIKDCKARFYMNNGNIGYVGAECEGKPLIPVTLNELNISQYYLDNKIKICTKQIDRRRQARIAFRTYFSIEKLKAEVQEQDAEIMNMIYREKSNMHDCYRFKFWISFLEVMRTRSLEDSSKALFAMAIFMFPQKTLDCVRKTVNGASDVMEVELKKTADFLNKYLEFLKELELESVEEGFSFHIFCMKFKKLTSIEIRYFIEEIICNPKVPNSQDTLYEIFSKALENNLKAKEKRGCLSKAIAILNKRGLKGA